MPFQYCFWDCYYAPANSLKAAFGFTTVAAMIGNSAFEPTFAAILLAVIKLCMIVCSQRCCFEVFCSEHVLLGSQSDQYAWTDTHPARMAYGGIDSFIQSRKTRICWAGAWLAVQLGRCISRTLIAIIASVRNRCSILSFGVIPSRNNGAELEGTRAHPPWIDSVTRAPTGPSDTPTAQAR
jgi:hypothetical protein